MTAIRTFAVTLLLVGFVLPNAHAADIPAEIDYLLTAIGVNCRFIVAMACGAVDRVIA